MAESILVTCRNCNDHKIGSVEVVCFFFFFLNLLQNDNILTLRCMHFIFCQWKKFKLYNESVLPVMKDTFTAHY